jgi:hypothetical protein
MCRPGSLLEVSMHADTAHVPILIAGAGPTGLVLAIALAKQGIPFRIIDDDRGPGEHSRAMVVHARTLEFYHQLGIADEVIAAGIKLERGRCARSTWQLHVYGDPSDSMTSACASLSLPIERRPWSAGAHAAHLQRDAGYLVRPDGHVALVISRDADAGELRHYTERFALRFSAPANR